MTDLATALPAILETVRRPGDFWATGAFDLLPPGIDIEGFGPLALPVLADQAARLIAAAAPAPFGRGEETIVDAGVRRSWQIAPDLIRITGRRWRAALDGVVQRAAAGLGAGEGVTAAFYKLLVYDVGSFFVDHRDTEKCPGMFATMVIALPSFSEGGELVVRHAGREARIDLVSADPAEARFAAFYADCVHEVRPVTAGCRVTLVYNLIRPGKALRPPRYEKEAAALAALLEDWSQEPPVVGALNEDKDDAAGGSAPVKLVYPLQHAYTPAELSFAALKGADAAAAGVLADAAARAAWDLHLALLTVEESGSADYVGYGRRGRSEADDYEIGEVIDCSQTLSAWRAPGGEAPDFGEMPVADGELSPPDAVEALEPDEQHFHEATGNEGASMERTYRRAALVLWPKAGFLPMIAAAGLPVSLPYLADLAGRHGRASGEQRAIAFAEACALADAMITRWSQRWCLRGDKGPTATTQVLDLLRTIGATDRIRQFLMRVDAAADRAMADNRAVIEAVAALPRPDRVAAITHLVDDTAPLHFALAADLLARAARELPDLEAGLGPAAQWLLANIPRDGVASTSLPWRRLDDRTVVNLLRAFCPIDGNLAEAAVEALLSAPKTFDMDGRLVPALCEAIADPRLAGTAALATLREACVAHLEKRVALPLAPPADFSRANTLNCACPECAALARFLADPTLETWSLKAIQQVRSHVETTIVNARCDAVTTTIRRGSPHVLAVTKTRASYERRAAQRREDLEIWMRISADDGLR